MSDEHAGQGFSGEQAGAWQPEERWFPASLDEIAAVRHWVGSCAERAGFDCHVVHELRVAVSEALTNVVRHAYGMREGPVRVGVSIENRRLVILIQDWGVPFAPEAWQPPDLSEPRAGGYGVMLMRLYVDEIICSHQPGESNLMLLTRALDSPPRSRPPADRPLRGEKQTEP